MLFYHFKKIKAPIVPYFSIFNGMKPKQHLFRAFSNEKKKCTLFLLFEQYNTSAVPYSTIFKYIRPQSYHSLAFSID